MDKDKKEKKVKQEVPSGEENFLLKKIRYYQGSIKDYETFWNQKIADGEREESPETKSFVKRNAELNKAFEIVPVQKDDTVICKDVVSGKDKDETPKENADAKPTGNEEGGKEAEKKAGTEVPKDGAKVDKVEKAEKKEKKEEKHEEEEEVKPKDVKKEEKGEDDGDDEKKKKKKEDKE